MLLPPPHPQLSFFDFFSRPFGLSLSLDYLSSVSSDMLFLA